MTNPHHSIVPNLLSPESLAEKPVRLRWWLRPKIVLPVLLFGLLLVGPFLYRGYRITRVPDIGEPFDVAEFEAIEFTQAENAADIYNSALRLLQPVSDNDALFRFLEHGWSEATPALIKWLDDNSAALEEWKRATELPDAMFVPPKEITAFNIPEYLQGLRTCSRLATLQAARYQGEGDVASAWVWLHAQLRASRHCTQNGASPERMLGESLFIDAFKGIQQWVADGRVDESLLNRAVLDFTQADMLTGHNAVCGKMDYLALRKLLGDTKRVARIWDDMSDHSVLVSRAEFFLLGEPEYSRRLSRLAVRYWLSIVDQPLWSRPVVSTVTFPASGAPAMSVTEMQRLLASDDALLSNLVLVFDDMDIVLQRESARRLILRQMMACHLFRRRHGDWPTKPEDLVPDLLPELQADPYGAAGETLRWKREGDVLLIYSVAEDRTDNGGNIDHSSASLRTDRGVRLMPPIAKPTAANETTRVEKN